MSFQFISSLIKNIIVKSVFSSYYLKLSMPVSYMCLDLSNFSLMFLIDMVS